MSNYKLNNIKKLVEEWCNDNNIYISTICDTFGLQGVKVYEKNANKIKRLLENLTRISNEAGIYLETKKVRGGHLLAFSLKALNESDIQRLLTHINNEGSSMTFSERVNEVFTSISSSRKNIDPPVNIPKIISLNDFEKAAVRIYEDAFKDATEGSTRCNQTSLARNRRTVEQRYSGVLPKHKHRLRSPTVESTTCFQRNLSEALDGMATPNDAQPGDLFKKFARALSVLGDQMGIGPLQDHLKQRGIQYKKSNDGQSIILYVTNAQTNAPQPIARISSETLSKPNDFQTALLNMIDFSQGQAPGAFKQKQEELRAQEKAVREIAQAFNPENNIASKVNIGAGRTQAPAAQTTPDKAAPEVSGQSPTPQPTAGIAAATQAATPKPIANRM